MTPIRVLATYVARQGTKSGIVLRTQEAQEELVVLEPAITAGKKATMPETAHLRRTKITTMGQAKPLSAMSAEVLT